MTKRILSVFVAVMMVLALVPAAVSAKAALGEGAVRDEAIASVEINGFEVPEWCNEPFYNVTVPEGAHYSVDDSAWFMYSTAFFDEMHPGESFDDPSMSYYMGVLLEPEEGWFFTEDEGQLSDDTVVLINGSDQYVNSTYITQDGYLAVYTVSFSVEDPSGEPIALHEISVNGFEVPPMIGWNSEDHLDLSVPAGAPYQLDLPNACWWNDDDDCEFEGIFEAGVNYSCGVTVFVNGNYYFADDCEFYINGGSVPIDPEYTEIDEEDNTVAYLWTLPTEAIPQGELIPIHEIYVNGFEDPVAGELASDHSSLTVPEGANYYTYEQTSWWNETTDEPVTDPGYIFEAGCEYSEGVTVVANTGYYFAYDCVIYGDGDTSVIDQLFSYIDTIDNTKAYVWGVPRLCEEEEPGLTAIHEVVVNGWSSPVEGMVGFDNVYLETPYDAPYFIIYGGWRDETDQQQMWSEEHVFIAGHEYSEGCQIWADEGYYFADDCVFLTDDEVELDLEWCYVDEYENYICYMNTVPVLCGEPEPGLTAIHEVIVNGWSSPVEGMIGFDNVYLETPYDAPYFIIYGGWRDETDQQQMWSEEHVFIAGHEYSEGCQIWADEGYYFADDCVFLTDDGVELDLEWCYVDEYENYICYMNTVPVVCESGAVGHVWGDADGDGDVDSVDTLLVMRAVMNVTELDPEHAPWCDVNGDGVIDMADALLIARFTMNLIPSLPV